MNTVQKNRCRSGERKKTMAKAVQADSATFPTVTSEAMMKLLSMALPRLARFQAACMFSNRRSLGMKLKGTLLICCSDWLAPEMMTMKGPISSRKPMTIRP